jgi:Protein of unknown function (DUF2934)
MSAPPVLGRLRGCANRAALEAEIARQTRIRENAYFRAQCRGFEPGREWDDWLAAEREVDSQLSAFQASHPAAETAKASGRS